MHTVYLVEGVVTGYARRTMNTQYITHHPQRATIEHRMKVLTFYDRYGTAATLEAFSVSRSTVYLWKQKLADSHGKLSALAPGSRAPKTRRRRTTDSRISDFIVTQRTLHPRLGKDKLAALLQKPCHDWGLALPSVSSVGRIVADLKAEGRLPKTGKVYLYGRTGRILPRNNTAQLKKRRRGSYQPEVPGDLVQIDTVVKFIAGIKRYCVTAVDVRGRFSFAYGYKSPSSTNAADFLTKLQVVAPFVIKRVQTDNGSEFYKYFHKACEQQAIVHFWNYQIGRAHV